MTCRISTALALCALCLPAAAENAPPKLRLPDTTRPVRYTADLRITPGENRFDGRIEIELDVREATPVIWLHAKALEFEKATIRRGNSVRPVRIEIGANDFTAVTAEGGFTPGRAVLDIRYSGEVSRKLTDGAFQQREGNDWYVFTKFEPVTARRVFPCFDEPSFKVAWRLTLHFPDGLRAFSNTPPVSEERESGGRVVRFAETKPLPTYLVAFAVGPFDVVETKPVGMNRIPSRIVVPKGRSREAEYAASVTPEFIALLETYFGTPYPYEKLDQIVVPVTTAWGAMENAGLIAYGQFLLNRPETDTGQRKQKASGTMLHELSHQWFGDLVTTAWWDDIWLNEGFASWLSAKLVKQWKPEWQSGLAAAATTSVLEADSFIAARRVRQPIEVPGDIGNAFDGITYGKGSAVIAMFEHYAGAEPFRKAVQLYLKRHAWGNATSSDLLAALDAVAGEGKGEAFATFLNQGGFPLIRADVRCGKGNPVLHLAQQRFLPLGSQGSAGETWRVPVCVKWGGPGGTGSQCVLLSKAEQEFALDDAKSCPAWAFADEDAAGYYSVMYENGGQDRLFEKAFPVLGPEERTAAIRNLQVLFFAGRGGGEKTLAIAARLSKTGEAENVRQSAALLASIYDMLPPELHSRYLGFMRAHFQARARSLGWKPDAKDSRSTVLLRDQIALWMATRGEDRKLRSQASRLADEWLKNRGSGLDPDSVTPVLRAAAWEGGRPFYERLVAAIRKSTVQRDREVMIAAIPWFRDRSVIRSALGLLFEPGIEPRELQTILFAARDEGRQVVWQFVKENFERLNSTLPGARGIPFGATLPHAAMGFCDTESADDVETFFRDRIAKLSGGPRNLANVLERIRVCAARTEAMRPAAIAFLKSQ